MPKLGSAVALLLFIPLAGAQAPKLDRNDPLDAVLMRWEKTMSGTESFLVKNCVRTEKDKTGAKTYQGEIRFLKPGYFALKMVQTNNPHIYELFVCTGNRLYDYRPQSKKLVIHELDPIKAGAVTSMQKFFLGMSAAAIKRQFEASLQTNVPGSNAEFVAVELKPRFPEDKRAFCACRWCSGPTRCCRGG